MIDIAITARRLIERHGAPVTLLSMSPTVYDTATQRNVAPAPVRSETRGVISDGNDTRDSRTDGLRRFYLATGSAAPAVNDQIEFGGASYTISDVLPIFVRGIVALYDVRAGRA